MYSYWNLYSLKYQLFTKRSNNTVTNHYPYVAKTLKHISPEKQILKLFDASLVVSLILQFLIFITYFTYIHGMHISEINIL